MRAAAAAAASCDSSRLMHDQQRLGRQELKAAQPLQVVALQVERAQRPAVFERGAALRDHVALALELGGLCLS